MWLAILGLAWVSSEGLLSHEIQVVEKQGTSKGCCFLGESASGSPFFLPAFEESSKNLKSEQAPPWVLTEFEPSSIKSAEKLTTVDGNQPYLASAPVGIDANKSWRQFPGADGRGVKVMVMDAGWNKEHEDFPESIFYDSNNYEGHLAANVTHGNSTVGIIAAPDNGVGITGIAPGVSLGLSYPYVQGQLWSKIKDFVDDGILGYGDILLLEMANISTPLESSDLNFEAIRYVVDHGVIVIEAAGNSATDFDNYTVNSNSLWAQKDSGAIIVAAGMDTKREPTDFTSYGSKISVHGWGVNVLSLGGGNTEYGFGSGTSSASAMVAGVAASIQGVAKAQGLTLSPTQMKDVLISTGTPQVAGDYRHIGPLPNARAAAAYVVQYAEDQRKAQALLSILNLLLEN